MIKKTLRFWLMVILVLAGVYLVTNPTMASKVSTQASRVWQNVVCKLEKVPELLGAIMFAKEEELPEPEQVFQPASMQPQQPASMPEKETGEQQDVEVRTAGKSPVEAIQQSLRQQSPESEVKMEDVLTSLTEKPSSGARGNPAVAEDAMSIEVLREIYARHMEALKIIASGVADEQTNE
ncbi:MAG: hypothetical protein JRJ12_13495 [Deltaproteobacteria bacterium]|nr:hypothetical protein [Deltaproteobacteria bacterium]MBW2072392.1 hypothetical protein [Deltaproteobacteria bacterium]